MNDKSPSRRDLVGAFCKSAHQDGWRLVVPDVGKAGIRSQGVDSVVVGVAGVALKPQCDVSLATHLVCSQTFLQSALTDAATINSAQITHHGVAWIEFLNAQIVHLTVEIHHIVVAEIQHTNVG